MVIGGQRQLVQIKITSKEAVMAKCLSCNSKVSIFKNMLLLRRVHECLYCGKKVRIRSRSVLLLSVLNAIIVVLIGLTAGVTGDYTRWLPAFFIWAVIFLLIYSAIADLEEYPKQ